MMYVNNIIMLYTLILYSAICMSIISGKIFKSKIKKEVMMIFFLFCSFHLFQDLHDQTAIIFGLEQTKS